MAYTSLFTNSAQTAAYAAFRPKYPPALYAALFSFIGLPAQGQLELAVDVATGSGQALPGLAPRCRKLVALDASPSQLSNALADAAHVELRQGDAHRLPFEAGSVDLVTVGQALHWLDRPRFYAEAARVLRPRTGTLAAWSYASGHVLPEGGPADRVFRCMLDETMGPYWAAPRKLVDDFYRGMEPMEPWFLRCARRELAVTEAVSVAHLVGYVSSWSSYVTYREQHPDRSDPLLEFQQQLLDACGTQDDTHVLAYSYQISMLMAQGPQGCCMPPP